MVGRRDLVEAQAFSRRRLVTAFVSGAPGGREVEAARPGRTVVGGAVLAVLLLAGGVASSVLAGRTAVDWDHPGLVISRELGQPYVITRRGLHPVVNITSARLVLGSSVEPVIVPDRSIQEQTIGPAIGIVGAPATVPDRSDLVETGWSACTAPHRGIRTYLAPTTPTTPAPEDGFVVQRGSDRWLVATSAAGTGAYRYLLPPSSAGVEDRFLGSVGLGAGHEAVRVPSAWLDLWPVGGALSWKSFGIPGSAYGKAVSYAGEIHVPRGLVGDLVQVGDTGYLLGPDGPIRLTAFARAVYLARPPRSGGPSIFHRPTMDRGALVSPYAAARWPAGSLRPESGELCAVLRAMAGSRPEVALASDPGDLATADAVSVGVRDAEVAPRSGAYVLSADAADATPGLPYLVDLAGTSHLLEGAAADRLGYGGYAAPVVPGTWLKLFRPGAVLSPRRARCARRSATAGERWWGR